MEIHAKQHAFRIGCSLISQITNLSFYLGYEHTPTRGLLCALFFWKKVIRKVHVFLRLSRHGFAKQRFLRKEFRTIGNRNDSESWAQVVYSSKYSSTCRSSGNLHWSTVHEQHFYHIQYPGLSNIVRRKIEHCTILSLPKCTIFRCVHFYVHGTKVAVWQWIGKFPLLASQHKKCPLEGRGWICPHSDKYPVHFGSTPLP